MTVITTGRISMSPITVTTRLSLDALGEEMGQHLYSGPVPSRGWGSIDDEDEYLNTLRGRPSPGKPKRRDSDELHPEVLTARYYYDVRDTRAAEYVGLLSLEQPQYRLAAVDLVLRESSQPNQLLGFVSSGVTAHGYNSLLNGIEERLQVADPNAHVQRGSEDVSFGDDDFFRWLLAQAVGDGKISDDLSVSIVRDMAGQDPLSRSSSVSQGASLDRPELLSMLARSRSTFGPAKFGSYYSPLALYLDLDLRQDGSFLLQIGNSWYEQPPPPSEERLTMVIDAATVVIPRLRSAYYADRRWPLKDRDAFIERAITELRAVVDQLVRSLGRIP